MSFYNMLFGMNSQTDLLLAVIGFKQVDVERFRDAHIENDGKTIAVYTRTGGGNREDYPQEKLCDSPLFVSSADDDFDSTYATFYFKTPDEFVSDVVGLSDILKHGLRAEFAQHLAKTLNRKPTEADKERAAYDAEAAALKRTNHFMANGHTFVPKDDAAMHAALKLAEANGGKLKSCWGILPITIVVKTNFFPYPNAKDEKDRTFMKRVDVEYDYRWSIDSDYWKHCQEVFANEFPRTMAEIAEGVARCECKK